MPALSLRTNKVINFLSCKSSVSSGVTNREGLDELCGEQLGLILEGIYLLIID